VPKVKTVEVANPVLGSSWLTEDMVVWGEEYHLRFQGFLYCLVDFQSLLVTPEHGDPWS